MQGRLGRGDADGKEADPFEGTCSLGEAPAPYLEPSRRDRQFHA